MSEIDVNKSAFYACIERENEWLKKQCEELRKINRANAKTYEQLCCETEKLAQELKNLRTCHSELVSESEKLRNLLVDFKDVNKQLGYKYLNLKGKLETIKEKCKEYNFSTDIYDESDILAGEILQIIEGEENE